MSTLVMTIKAIDPSTTTAEEELQAMVATSEEAKGLRARTDVVEFRSVLQIADEHQVNNLTCTTLKGIGKIEVSPIVFADNANGTLLAFYRLGASLEGHAGILHGGMAATLLDEVMGRACFPLLPNKIAVTANLNINYRAPIQLGGSFIVRGVTLGIERNKARVKGSIESPGGKVFVEAEALFIDPRFGSEMSKMM